MMFLTHKRDQQRQARTLTQASLSVVERSARVSAALQTLSLRLSNTNCSMEPSILCFAMAVQASYKLFIQTTEQPIAEC
jgi:hypothetical protein